MIFTERLEQKEWWSGQASLLNLSDINLPPDYYNGSEWDWIREITAYTFREPETWQDIYKEYLVKAQQQANTEHTRLNYYRDEEGYIRREREEDTYLKISMSTADIIVLKKVGDWMCANNMKFRLGYVSYCEMPSAQRIQWLKRMETYLKETFSEVHSVGMVHGLEEAQFNKTEVFYDFLNTVYIIL
mgnify:FL=1